MQHGKYKGKLYRGVWCVTWHDKRTKRLSLKTTCRDTAEQLFHEAVRQLEAPNEIFRDVWESWKRDKMNSQVTRAEYSEKHLLPHFGNLRPDQINRVLCRAYITKRRKDRASDGTIVKELGQARSACYWYKKDVGQWEFPPRPAPKDRFLSKEEYSKLLDAAQGHIRLFIILALNTAARKSALLELTWNRVDFERNQIKLATEDESGRKGRATVPIGKALRKELLLYYENRTCDYVIEYSGGPIKDVRKGVSRTAKKAGLKDVYPHVLRHTAAVWLAEANIPITVIAQYLGHTDSRITERVYARYSPSYLQGCAEVFDEVGT